VWVDGKQLVGSHRLLTGDEDAIRAAAQSSAEELFARRRRVLASQ
jgi:5-methylthioadenosine/S-adenosylhomocysteine deaminase